MQSKKNITINSVILILLIPILFLVFFGCKGKPDSQQNREKQAINRQQISHKNIKNPSNKHKKNLSLKNEKNPCFLTHKERTGKESYNKRPSPDLNNWIMFMANYQHTGESDSTPIKGKIIAKIPTGGRIMGSPVIYKNRAYICSMNGYLYCIGLSDNPRVLWKFKAGNKLTSTPGVDNAGNIYIGSQDKHLYGINPDGSLKWKYRTGGPISSGVNFDFSGANIITGSLDGYIYCISREGKIKWKFKTGHTELEFTSTPATGYDQNIFVGSDNGNFYAVNKDGKQKWSLKLGKPVVSSPSIDKNGNIYVGCNDTCIYSISPDGKIRWKYKTGGAVESSPVIDNKSETIFSGSADSNIYAIDFKGNLKWKYKTGGAVNSSGAYDAMNNLYFSSEDGCVYSLLSSGKLRWKTKCGGVIIASPAISSGYLIVGSEDGNVYMLK